MSGQRYCIHCQDWIPPESFADHMKQHNVGLNSDAVEHKQYTGSSSVGKTDYMICILHQKKCPCPVKGCKYQPFGMIKKGLMMQYFKDGEWHWHDRYGNPEYVKIDTDTKIVVLFGVPIKLRL